MKNEWHSGLGESGPQWIEIGMRGREVTGSLRRYPNRCYPLVDCLFERQDCSFRVSEGYKADGHEARIRITKCRHRPVECLGAPIEDAEILAPRELDQGEGREDQLCVDPEGIEHPRADFGVKSTRSHPALRPREHLGADLLVAVLLPEVRKACHQVIRLRSGTFKGERQELVSDLGIGEGPQPILSFHQVTVGVEDRCRHQVASMPSRVEAGSSLDPLVQVRSRLQATAPETTFGEFMSEGAMNAPAVPTRERTRRTAPWPSSDARRRLSRSSGCQGRRSRGGPDTSRWCGRPRLRSGTSPADPSARW